MQVMQVTKRAMTLHGKEHGGLGTGQELGEAKKGPPLRSHGEHGPAHTLTLDFQPPEL